MGLSAISLFSGAGGLDLAAKWAGIRTVCYVENDPYAQAVLMSRMRDGSLDDAPIWDEVCTFNGRLWRGKVDCVFGGFPCQDVSYAGKGAGLKDGTRSGLWSEFSRIIGEARPRYVLVENVPGLLARGVGRVFRDLAKSGYDCSWYCLGASHVGAPHRRNRVWIIAYPFDSNTDKLGWDRAPIDFDGSPEFRDKQERDLKSVGEDVADARYELRNQRRNNEARKETQRSESASKPKRCGEIISNAAGSGRKSHGDGQLGGQEGVGPEWWAAEPNVGRAFDGLAKRMDDTR